MFEKISEEIDSRNNRLRTRFSFTGSLTELVKNFKSEEFEILTFYVEPNDREAGVPNAGGYYDFSEADIIDHIYYEIKYIHIDIMERDIDLFLYRSNEILAISDSQVDMNDFFKTNQQ